MSARTRSAGHAQDTRGSRIADVDAQALAALAAQADADAEAQALADADTDTQDTQDVPDVITQESAADTDTQADALAVAVRSASATDAINAVINEHFGKSLVKFLRTVLYSADVHTRNRVLFRRQVTADAITYDLCGYTAQIRKNADGLWRAEGFLFHAQDASGGVFQKRYGDGTSAYDSKDVAQRNMFAGFRNGVQWILLERETQRKATSSAANTQELALLQKELAEARARADAAEQKSKADAEALARSQAENTNKLEQVLQRLQALDGATKAQA